MSSPENPYVHSASVTVDATPDEVYAAVSDVTRTGEWSPICRECTWEDGAGPQVGAWFTGRNEVPGRTWETRSQVVAAEPGREFAWQVGGTLVRWGYTMARAGEQTELTEHWEFLPAGLSFFREKFSDDAQREIDDRTDAAHRSIPETLEKIRASFAG